MGVDYTGYSSQPSELNRDRPKVVCDSEKIAKKVRIQNGVSNLKKSPEKFGTALSSP